MIESIISLIVFIIILLFFSPVVTARSKTPVAAHSDERYVAVVPDQTESRARPKKVHFNTTRLERVVDEMGHVLSETTGPV